MRIAIIGAGIAGIQTLGALTARRIKLEIHLFDKPAYAGRGMPFIPDHPGLLLNQPQAVMNLVGAKTTFTGWLKANHPNVANDRFATRIHFGDYARDTFTHLLQDERVQFHPVQVDTLRKRSSGGFQVLAGKRSFGTFDTVFLCIGQLPYNDPYKLEPSPCFIADPYPLTRSWKTIAKTRSIGLLGSGLSTLDMIVFLAARKYPGHIYIVSKSGRFPSVRGDEPHTAFPRLNRVFRQKQPELSAIVRAFEAEIGHQGLDLPSLFPAHPQNHARLIRNQIAHPHELGLLQQMENRFEPHFQRIWNHFSLADQRAFFEQYREDFLLLQSPMPAASAETLAELLESGQAEVVSDIETVRAEAGIEVITAKGPLTMAYLLNGTGPAGSLEEAGYQDDNYYLAQQLVDERILQPDPLSGFSVSLPGFCAISQRYGVQPDLRVHGQLVAGVHFANNSVTTIGEGVQQSVDDLLG